MSRAAITAPPLLFCVLATVAHSQPLSEQGRHPVRSQGHGWWSTQLEIRLGERDGGRGITGLSCALRGEDGVTLELTRPVESGQFHVQFEFALEHQSATIDPDLIERRVVSLGVGDRVYQFDRIQWRFSPAFLGWEPPPPGVEVLLSYGITMPAFRAGEGYPWLPVEYLIPELMEIETLRLGYRGKMEITHGDYQTVYRERKIRMAGFRQGMDWCGEALRSERTIELPMELRRTDP